MAEEVFNLWDTENRVYSRVKKLVSNSLKTKYPKITFTDSDKVPATVNYPYIYIHELEGMEIGQDLENVTVNGIISAFEIVCYSNTSQDVNKEVMHEVTNAMKSMHYNMSGIPHNDNDDNFRRVARYRRILGSGDTL